MIDRYAMPQYVRDDMTRQFLIKRARYEREVIEYERDRQREIWDALGERCERLLEAYNRGDWFYGEAQEGSQ